MAAECQIRGCGVIALGRCLECNRPFCSTHQAKIAINAPLVGHLERVDRCIECQARLESEIARRRASAAIPDRPASATAEDVAGWELECQRAVGRLRGINDSSERLVTACRYLCNNPYEYNPLAQWSGSSGPSTLRPIEAGLFSAVFPEYWTSAQEVNLDSANPPWDSELIAQWFARKARAEGRLPGKISGSRGPGLFSRELKGWLLDSTEYATGVTGERGGYLSVIIDLNGRLRPCNAKIPGRSLYKIADILKMQDPGIKVAPRPH